MKVNNRIPVKLILIVALVVALFGTGCSGGGSAPVLTPSPVSPVEEQPDTDTGSFSNQAVAEARIIPTQFVQLSFARDGVLDEIFVSEGEAVKAGDVLACLRGSEQLESSVVSAELALIKVEQELNDLHENAGQKRSGASLELAAAGNAVDNAEKRLQSKDFQRGSEYYIKAAYAEYILAKASLREAEKDFQEVSDRQDIDNEKALRLGLLAEARARVDRSWERVIKFEAGADPLKLALAQGQLNLAQERLKIAQKDWEAVKTNGIDPEDLALMEARMENAEAQLHSAQLELEDQEIRAPFDGILLDNHPMKVGQVVTAGSVVATLADVSSWKVETIDLNELDVVNVSAGMPVKITLDAIPGLEITGKVERIKDMGVNVQGDITYTAILTLDETDERLRWNMTAFVEFGP